MRFACALAAAATISQAATLQQPGRVIDLCPDVAVKQYAAPMTSIYNLPSSQASQLGNIDKAAVKYLKDMQMYKEQEGIAAAQAEVMAKEAKLKQLANIKAVASAIQESRFNYQQPARKPVGRDFVDSFDWDEKRGWGNARPVSVVTRENLVGKSHDYEQRAFVQIPVAFKSDNYVTKGLSYSPVSYTPGSSHFDANCAGQAVLVYPESNSEVLFCGERNLQGNQTLKRTNIHHNYVHDINHNHNYHNRIRHAAKQFNTVEKDCSCQGYAVEAAYQCPPAIQTAAALKADCTCNFAPKN